MCEGQTSPHMPRLVVSQKHMPSNIPLPPREQLYNRYCSNKQQPVLTMHAPSWRALFQVPPPFFTRSPFRPCSLVREGQTSPHKPRLVVSHSTCPPLSPSPHANGFVIGTAALNNNYSSGGDKGDNNKRRIIYGHIDPTNITREPQTYVRTAAMYISFINPINKQSRRSRVYTPLVLGND